MFPTASFALIRINVSDPTT